MKFQSIFLISILSIFSACSDKSDKNEYLNQQPPNWGTYDCFSYIRGFIDTYKHSIESDDIFFVKGVVTTSGSYGKKIRITEDIKGNLKEHTSITLWNHWEFGVADLNYGVNDAMLMLMSKINYDSDVWGKQRLGDYCTIGCSYSTLLFTDGGNVSGIFNNNGEKTTMPWKDLQALLNDDSEK